MPSLARYRDRLFLYCARTYSYRALSAAQGGVIAVALGKAGILSAAMDPITAVGFAASILTFIDFGYEIVTGTLEIVKSGSTSENIHVSVVIGDLHEVVKSLSPPPVNPPSTPLGNLPGKPSAISVHESALKRLAEKCQELSNELVTLLKNLSAAPGSSLWVSARVALRNMRKKGKVADLEDKLDKYRSEMLVRIVLMLK